MQTNVVFAAFTRPAFSLFLFGGLGVDLGMSTMTIDVPQVVELLMVEDPTRFDTFTALDSVSGGAQCNIPIGDFIASPFGSLTFTAGMYSYTQTSAMSFKYPSGSGNIDSSSSTSLGFDLL